MSEQVKRYSMHIGTEYSDVIRIGQAVESPTGDYVLHTDLARVEQANAELRAEVGRLRAHRDGLYRVFGWLARDDRKMLSAVDETIQADVDSIIADRARQTARVEALQGVVNQLLAAPWNERVKHQSDGDHQRADACAWVGRAMEKIAAALSQPEAGT